MTENGSRTSIAVLIFDGVEELDFVGPWEVFTMAKLIGAPLNIFTVGWPGVDVRCAKGLRVTADHAFADAPEADVVIVPGGRGTRPLAKNADFIDALRPYLAAARFQVSVCTGAGLLGKTGFLDHRKATTNREAFDFFRDCAPLATLVEDKRWVHDDNVVTSAGVSAGIDMSLWLLSYLFGEIPARDTQKYMEYFPEPPFGKPAA